MGNFKKEKVMLTVNRMNEKCPLDLLYEESVVIWARIISERWSGEEEKIAVSWAD
jgi:hypothetical protein